MKNNELDGYSNLTEAIERCEPIDWEKLDGLKAKYVYRCEDTSDAVINHVLERDDEYPLDELEGWSDPDTSQLLREALYDSWWGVNGWSLWIEGEIPIKRKTADQLPLGMCFRDADGVLWQTFEMGTKTIYADRKFANEVVSAKKLVVAKEYQVGSFRKARQ